jgi:multidrug efflux pump subunit AcrB
LDELKGAATPFPYGGKVRQIQVDLDLPRLQACGLQPSVNVAQVQPDRPPS